MKRNLLNKIISCLLFVLLVGSLVLEPMVIFASEASEITTGVFTEDSSISTSGDPSISSPVEPSTGSEAQNSNSQGADSSVADSSQSESDSSIEPTSEPESVPTSSMPGNSLPSDDSTADSSIESQVDDMPATSSTSENTEAVIATAAALERPVITFDPTRDVIIGFDPTRMYQYSTNTARWNNFSTGATTFNAYTLMDSYNSAFWVYFREIDTSSGLISPTTSIYIAKRPAPPVGVQFVYNPEKNLYELTGVNELMEYRLAWIFLI